MEAIIKKIQARLRRQGIRKSYQEIREVYHSLFGQNINPTEKEIRLIVAQLTEDDSKDNSQIVPVTEVNNIPTESYQLVDVSHTEAEDNQGSSAIVFSDPFSKALVIQQTIASNQIQLSNSQVFEIANQIPNEYSDQMELAESILIFIDEKYNLDTLRSRLIVDKKLEELKNKQEQFRLETQLKMQKTFELMKENVDIYRQQDLRLLDALKESYRRSEEKRMNKNNQPN